MAKSTKEKLATETAVTKKTSGVKNPGLTREELIAQGPRGIIKLLALTAVKLAARNDFADVVGFGNSGKAIKSVKGADGKETDASSAARKAAANKIQPQWSNGSLSKLAEIGTGAEYDKLLKLAKAAAADLEKQVYSDKIKSFLQFMTEGHGGGGTRSFNTTDMSKLGGLL